MIRTRSVRRRLWLSACAVFVFSFATAGWAQTSANWLNTVSGNWTDPTMWSSNPFYPNNGHPAGATYSAYFQAAGQAYDVTLDSDVTISELRVFTPDATLWHQAGRFRVSDYVGINAGTYQLAGGTLDLTGASVGVGFADGSALFMQTGGTVHQSSDVRYRAATFGTRGSIVPGVPSSGGTATVIIDGPDAKYLPGMAGSVPANLFGIGTSAIGHATIRNGAYAELGDAEVGIHFGTGTLSVESGAHVRMTGLHVGWGNWYLSGSNTMDTRGNGTVTLSGSDSRITLTPDLTIPSLASFTRIGGNGSDGFGHGTLIINDGTFESSGTVVINQLGTLQVKGGQYNVATFASNGGTMNFAGGISMVDRLSFGGFGGTLTISGGSLHVLHASTLSAASSRVIVAGGALTCGGTFTISGGTFAYQSGTVEIEQLRVTGGRLLMPPGGAQKLFTRGLEVSGTAVVDAGDSRVIVDYTGSSPLLQIRGLIASGYAAGMWNGTGGINSSVAAANPRFGIAYAESSALFTSFPAPFGGYEVDNTSILITYARYGDANLDGVVNLADFNRLAANFGSSGAVWSQGDFNYDSMVNLADFNLLAANFGLTAAGPEVTPQDWAALASAVPEPGAGLLLAGAAMLATRRPTQCATPGKTGEARAAA